MILRLAALTSCLACLPLSACGNDGSAGGAEAAEDVGGADAVTPADTATPGEPDDAGSVDSPEVAAEPFAELYEQGVLRYLGAEWEPSRTSEGSSGAVAHVFEDEDGPRCFTGEEFFVSTRDGASDDLMIFVQGGGVCGPNACGAVESWPLFIPAFGILDPQREDNPAADFDLGYIPYCDGSLFIGDADHDIDGDGVIDRSHRGLLNLSAALDLIADRYPSPSRIFLVGNSAGGMGVHFALPLVRALYPDVAIDIINDSGVGIFQPGTMEELLEYWDADAFFPASCSDCISAEGHITGYHAYQLREDANVRLGYVSARQDEVIVDSLSETSGEQFEAALVAAAALLNSEFPERFNSMIIAGSDHTFVVRDFDRVVADTTIGAWLTEFLANGDGWVSVAE